MRTRDQLEDSIFTSWFQTNGTTCGSFQIIGKSFRYSLEDVASKHEPNLSLQVEDAVNYDCITSGARWSVDKTPGVQHVHELLVETRAYRSYSCTVADSSSRVEVKIFNEGSSFNQDLSVLIGVDHPNLVKLMNMIIGPPNSVISSLCQFGTVETLLHHATNSNRLTNLTISARLHALMQVASALEFLHDLHIVHRNVAPENCFLSEPLAEAPAQILEVPTLQLGNFEDARTVDGDMSTFVGNVRYMPPEVMQSGCYGPLADVFSCGILLHEIITGRIPYNNCEHHHMLALKVFRGLRPDSDLFPVEAGGAQVRSIAEKCWSTDPFERPSATTLKASFKQLIGELDNHFG
jgi:serine/threonine protein kinase